MNSSAISRAGASVTHGDDQYRLTIGSGISSSLANTLGMRSPSLRLRANGLQICSMPCWASRDDGKHYDYPTTFFMIAIPHGLSYVGEQAPIATIPAGTLVRVSLARWWRPDDDESFPERCYVQLSGWY